MLYKNSKSPELKDESFKNPTSEFRGAPFWAWNNLLTKDELCRQIEIFKEMGLGGFHMHVRTGLKNKYLSDEFMELIKACVEKAKKENMLSYLYDEDRWPSGAAGGFVTENEDFRARSLVLTTNKKGGTLRSAKELSRAEATRSGEGRVLACYDVVLDSEGYLKSYKRINENDEVLGTRWYAVLEICAPNSWYNDKSYADTLNKKAIEKFIQVTHEKYKNAVGEDFGKTIPSIFTDEPQFTRKQTFGSSFDKIDVAMPWTDSVQELYKEKYNCDIFDTLPELFWDLKGSAPSVHRYRYHDFISELFTKSFADTVGAWCEKNNIYLTGHMMEEPTLKSQTAALGEAMRSYRGFQLPGIDLLCNRHEFTTAKQAQSASHQFLREGVLSELYGVTGWDADFRKYKHQGDWQAALGITLRVPHLSWYAMEGEAKRDYPASISYQSSWYKEFSQIENHFARVNTALTRGKALVNVGVIHPVESYWLHWGPKDKTALLRDDLDEKFQSLTSWLLKGSIDFDFISESLLKDFSEQDGEKFKVNESQYKVVIVPDLETIRKTTLDRLQKFKKSGGRVIFLGSCPTLLDGEKSEEPQKLYDISEKIPFTKGAVLSALENERDLTIRNEDGSLTDNLIYQLRKDNSCSFLFIAHTEEPQSPEINKYQDIRITIKGEYSVLVYDTENGDIYPADFKIGNGNTVISEYLYPYSSRLYKLSKDFSIKAKKREVFPDLDSSKIYKNLNYDLSEENVLLLDMAKFRLKGEKDFSQEEEEILRLDNIVRRKLGLNERGGEVCQPWVYGEKEPVSAVELKYTFNSEIEYENPFLAMEAPEKAKITFNGKNISNKPVGNFVDISIFKLPLSKIVKGENALTISLPFGESSNLEAIYILGDFGVSLKGTEKTVIKKPQTINFGSITEQGFPFYSGEIIYKIPVNVQNNSLSVISSSYKGALISASLDDEEIGKIIYPPYYIKKDNLKNGEHILSLKVYLSRYNTFGQLHLANQNEEWQGPFSWRSEGSAWSYEYILKKSGILKSPIIE